MAALLHSDSRRAYSWWWDSHISPKNSKWLQENLTDMDLKVKTMIKLIDEDADSFARRAEMYYKKRPELMKLVEEFYRVYRALAERYDHATGALRQAHRTMSEAFPNQIPYTLTDESPTGSSVGDAEPHTPEMPHPIRALFDPDDLQKDALGVSSNIHAIKRNGAYSEENDPATSKKGLKQLNEMFLSGEGVTHVKFAEGKVRKGLNFREEEGRGSENIRTLSRDHQKHEAEEKDDEKRSLQDEVSHLSMENQSLKKQVMSESERAGKAEIEIQRLQQALSKLQDEKEDALLQYQQCLERLSDIEKTSNSLQNEVSQLSTENQNLTMQIVSESQRASNAKTEVQSLEQALSKLEAEKEASLQQYQQCLEKISNMETKISSAEEDAKRVNNENENLRTQVTSELECAGKAETEVQSLQQALSNLRDEKEVALQQHQQFSEKILNVETEISRAVEDVKRLDAENQNLKTQVLSESERVGKAETEVRSLQQALSKVQDEKEAVLLQYQQSLEKISNMESEISHTEEIVKRLNSETQMGVTKLNSAEARCLVLETENQSLQSEVDALVQKTMLLQEKLVERHEELEKLSICIQEERMHCMQAEEAIISLQNLHSKSLEDQRILASELQHLVQILRETEFRKRELEDKVQRVKEENNGLSEQSLASAVLLKNLQDEIVGLREMKGKFEEEVGLRVDERNALQQELYCLKEELNDLDRRYGDVIGQVESVGLKAQCLGASVKELQDENLKMKEICKKDEGERIILLEKNTLLENSLSDANVELEGLREKLKTLEESIQSLCGEKSALVTEKDILVAQVESISQNITKLSEKSAFFEISLSDANAELNGLRGKSRGLEESFHSLHSEKSGLIDERNVLISRVGSISQSLENLEEKYVELEVKHSCLETEQQSALRLVDELQVSLELQNREHSSFVDSSKTQLAALQNQLDLLLEEGRWRRREFEEEQDKVVKAQVEIFILQRCIQDMRERNLALLLECQKHVEASMDSEKRISELEQVNIGEQVKVKSLLEHQEKFEMLVFQVLKALRIDMGNGYSDKIEAGVLLLHILGKIEDMQSCILDAQDEKQQLLFEISVHVTLLNQLMLELSGLKSEKNTLELESEIRREELSVLQLEKCELLVMSEQLKQDVQVGDHREVEIRAEMEILCRLISELKEAQQKLENENRMLLEEKQSLGKEFCRMREEKCILEEENNVILGEVMTLGNLSLIFESYGTEKAMEIKALNDNLEHFRGANDDLEKKVTVMAKTFETVESENSHLRESVEKMEEHRSRLMVLEDDLNTARDVSQQLNHQIEFGKNLLSQKETELLLALQMVDAIQVEKTELHRDLEGLKNEYDYAKMTNEDLEKQIFKVSEANTHHSQEIEHLRGANDKLESELCTVQNEIEELRIRQEHLNSDMQNSVKEAELWEAEAATLYSDLQISAVHAALFEEKVCELIGVCGNLKEGAMNQRKISDTESASRIADIEVLKNNLDVLEGKNGDLKAELTAYLPLILSLKDSVTSLEDHTLSLAKIPETSNQQIVQDGASLSDQEPCEDGSSLVETGLLELQNLQTKVQAVEKSVMEIEKLAMQERFNLTVKLEAATKEVEDLKLKSSSFREEVQTSRDIDITLEKEHTELGEDVEQHKNEAEINKVKSGLMMKDIQLDHVSDSSSYENGVGSYGKSHRENAEADDQMLELWETAEHFYSRPPTANKMKKPTSSATENDIECHQIDAVEEQHSQYPSPELHAEKELAVDKLEVRNKVLDSNHGHQRIIERLASDARRLSNLQTNLQELKKRTENSDSSDLPASNEYDMVKRQLKEVEETISQLVDVNGKLTKDAEVGSTPSDGKVLEIEEMGKMRKRQVSERARRGSEKIGWLELELQKIQFLLLKLEDENQSKGTKAVERRRVLLRDYLYGRKDRQKRKKVPFCACVRPSTKGHPDHAYQGARRQKNKRKKSRKKKKGTKAITCA